MTTSEAIPVPAHKPAGRTRGGFQPARSWTWS